MKVLRLLLSGLCGLLGALLVLPVLAIGLPFLVVCYLTRSLAWLLEPRYAAWSDLIEFNAKVGWKPKGAIRSWHLCDDVFWSSTDPDGWRGESRLADSEIVVMGDSFAWGQGIGDGEFFAGLVHSLRVKAIGANGYSLVQELLWLRDLAPALHGKIVVWLVYLGNDLHDNVVPSLGRYRRPFVRQIDASNEWEIVTSHISPARWPMESEVFVDRVDYYRRLAELCSNTMFAERAFSACAWLIQEGADLCRSAGAHLVVLSIPDQTQLAPEGIRRLRRLSGDRPSFDPALPDRRLGIICGDLNVAFLPGRERFNAAHYKELDCHWNRTGHRRMAEVLAEIHETRLRDRDGSTRNTKNEAVR